MADNCGYYSANKIRPFAVDRGVQPWQSGSMIKKDKEDFFTYQLLHLPVIIYCYFNGHYRNKNPLEKH